jgi:iron complex outermembrane receptor protein
VTEIGPFVQSALRVTPQVTVTGGLRYDWVKFQVHDRLITGPNPDDSGDRLMNALSGSLGLAVTPSTAFTAYANVGTSFETPTTTELTNRPDTAGGFNPTLQPRKATNYEVGVRGLAAGRLSYSVALFQADVRDELIAYQVPASSRTFFRNAGRSRHRGIELGSDLQVVAGVDVITAWTYSDFRYQDYMVGPRVLDGQALPGIPQHWLHLLVKAQPALARGIWMEVEETHSSGFAVDDTMPASLAPHTSPWWTTNVRLGWNGTVGSVRCNPFVGFDNVFNRRYVGSVVINAANRRYYEPAPGRNLYVGFSLGAGE